MICSWYLCMLWVRGQDSFFPSGTQLIQLHLLKRRSSPHWKEAAPLSGNRIFVGLFLASSFCSIGLFVVGSAPCVVITVVLSCVQRSGCVVSGWFCLFQAFCISLYILELTCESLPVFQSHLCFFLSELVGIQHLWNLCVMLSLEVWREPLTAIAIRAAGFSHCFVTVRLWSSLRSHLLSCSLKIFRSFPQE